MKEESRKLWEAIGWKSPQERTEIQRGIAKEIEEVLYDHGFVKTGYTFLRIYGDYLVQGISVVCPARVWKPGITVAIRPMYDSVHALHKGWVWDSLRTIRSNGWDDSFEWWGRTIESLLGIRLNPLMNSYLAEVEEWRQAIEIEKTMLTDSVLPLLSEVKTPMDTLKFFTRGTDGRYPIDVRKKHGFLPYLLREHQWEDAKENVQTWIKNHHQWLQERRQDELFASPGMTDEELEQFVKKLRPGELEFHQEWLQILEQQQAEIVDQRIDEAIRYGYEQFSAVSKTLVKKYPLKNKTCEV